MKISEMERKFRKIIKNWYKTDNARKTDAWTERAMKAKPLTERSRFITDHDDWDSYTEYGFLHGTDYTDEELEEIREDMRLRVTSPYDCSGQRFTMWITFHRNPSGLISYTHRIGIDV